MRAWSWVIIGGMFETGWALCMKMSRGFSLSFGGGEPMQNIPLALTDLPLIFWTISTIVILFIGIFFLDHGMKKGEIPIGAGYAVWVGVGGVGALIGGIAVFGDSMLWTRLLFAAIIIIGIIGVELTSHREPEKAAEKGQDG